MNLSPEISSIALWLEEQKNKYPYSDISICLHIHANEIRRIERGVIEKLLGSGTDGNG